MNTYKQANFVFPYVASLRKYFHINPELSGQEENTYYKIICELKKMKISYETVGEYSIVAYINKDKLYDKSIAFRSQMDALPVQDYSAYPYKSRHKNITHSSGHDITMAVLLGAIKQINDHRNKYDGCIAFIFESNGHYYRGAQDIIKHGILKDIDYLYSLQCLNDIPESSGAIYNQQQLLGADVIEIKWYGKAQPSSRISSSKDTIMAAAHFTANIRSNISSRLNPTKIAIVTITKFQGGFIHDITANYCEIVVNIRYQDNETKKKIHQIINETLKSSETQFQVKTTNKVIHSIPPFTCDSEAATLGKYSFLNIKDNLVLHTIESPIYSEGFSLYGDRVKAAMGIYGTNEYSRYSIINKNNPHAFDDESLKIGIAWHLSIASNYLKK